MKTRLLLKSVLTTMILLLTIAVGHSATYYSRGSGNWNDVNTWSTTGYGGVAAAAFPAAGDDVNIGGAVLLGPRTVTITANAACSSIAFESGGANATLQLSPGISLAVSGNVTIPTAGNFIGLIFYANTLAIDGGIVTIGGNLNYTNTNTTANQHEVSISSGNLTVTGNVTTNNSANTSPEFIFTGSGTLNLGGSIWANTSGQLTTSAGCTIDYNGAAQTVQNFNYQNLILSGSGTKTFTSVGSATAIVNTLTIGSGVIVDLGTYTGHTANAIMFGMMPGAIGTHGGTGSGATNTNPLYFAANTGIITAATGVGGPVHNVFTNIYYATIQAAINAALNGDVIEVTMPGIYNGAIFNPGDTRVVELINTSGGTVIVVGASPAFTVSSGTLVLSGITATTATNDPTILVNGSGSLDISNCIVNETAAGNQSCIDFSGTGTVNAGDGVGNPGLNTFNVNGSILLNYTIKNATATVIPAINNYWGAASGPYNATSNKCGAGGIVSDNVTFYPWYTDPAFTLPFVQPAVNVDNVTACNATTYPLSGTVPVQGIGCGESWSLVGAPANMTGTPFVAHTPVFANPNQAVTDITGLLPGYVYTILYTVTVDGFTTTDVMTLTNYAPPTAATVALTPTAYCNVTSFNLIGNAPIIGTGVWSVGILPAGGTATIVSPSSASTTVSVLAPASTAGVPDIYSFVWTISNGVCSPSDASATITNYTPPAANAGPDQQVCYPGAVTLDGSATTGDIALYTWSGGSPGAIVNVNDISPVYNPTLADYTAGSVTLSLFVTSPGSTCVPSTDQMTITFDKDAPVVTACPGAVTTDACSETDLATITGLAYSTTPVVVTEIDANTQGFFANDGTGLGFGSFSYVDVYTSGVCPIVITRTWIATDICGNVNSSCQQVFTLEDNTAPTADPLADVNVVCIADIPVADINDVTNEVDNCGGPVVVAIAGDVTSGAGCVADPYIVIRSYTLTDQCDNVATITQTLTAIDNIQPVMSALPIASCYSSVALAEAAALAATTAVDNCLGTVTFAVSTVGTCVATVSVTASDFCGNIATTTFTTRVDDTAPVFVGLPTDVTVDCNAVPTVPVVTATDNCDGNLSLTNNCSQVGFAGGFDPTNWTFNANGGTGSVVATPTQISLNGSNGGTGTPIATDYTITIPCDGYLTFDWDYSTADVASSWDPFGYALNASFNQLTVDAGVNSGNVTQVGTMTVAVKSGDVFGFSIRSVDNVLGASASIITNFVASNEMTFAEVSTQGADPAACDYYTYQITRTWNAVDACGNLASDSQIITVQDLIDPVVTITAPILDCYPTVGDAEAAALAATASSDICADVANLTTDVTTVGTCSAMITVTVTDPCSNASSVVFYTRIDNSAPALTCPAAVDIDGCDVGDIADVAGLPAYSATATNVTYAVFTAVAGGAVTDDCTVGADLVISYQDSPGVGTCPTIVIRTWTVEDECGNVTDCTQQITIDDITAPVWDLPLPLDITIDCDATVPAAPILTATDYCGVFSTDMIDEIIVPGTCINDFTIVRTWRAIDFCGNYTPWSQQIHVQDITLPEWTSVAGDLDMTIECSDPSGLAAAQALEPVASDNCTGVITYVKTAGTFVAGTLCPQMGTITNTWTATDVCDNVASTVFTQVITIVDTQDPTFTQPADITIYTDATCAYDADPTITGDVNDEADNCTTTPVVTYADVTVDGACEGAKIITRTWTVTDDCDNAASLVQTITVLDNIDPTFTQPADITIYTDINCNYNSDPSVTGDVMNEDDNCTVTPVVTFADVTVDGPCVGSKVITRTWTVTDDCGNAVSLVQTITVEDNIDPTFTVPADITIYTDVNCNYDSDPSVTGDVTDAADNCSTPVVTFADVTVDGPCTGSKIITRTWTVTDDCDNFVTDVQTITVNDNIAPTVSNPAPLALQCIFEVPLPDVTVVLGETDNCTASNMLAVAFAGDVVTGVGCVSSPYIVTRSYTVTDDCDNVTTVVHTITVIDDTEPVVTCPTDKIYCSIPGDDFLVLTDDALIPTYSDNCTASNVMELSFTTTGATVISTPVMGDIVGQTFAAGYTTVTYEVKDFCGNTSNCTFVVRVIATIEAKAGPDLHTCLQPNYVLVAEDPGPTAVGSWSWVPEVGVPAPTVAPGPTQYTAAVSNMTAGYTYKFRYYVLTEGICEDADTMQLTVWQQAPAANAGADQTLCDVNGVTLVGNGGLALPTYATGTWTFTNSVPAGVPVAPSVVQTGVTAAVTGFTAGYNAYVFTWTTSTGGYCPDKSETVTVFNPGPAITCPAAAPFTNVPVDAGVCFYTVPAAWNAVATDNCNVTTGYSINGGASVATLTGQQLAPGAYTVVATATDLIGNVATCSFTATVIDTQNPTITCPASAPYTVGTDANVCSYTVKNATWDAAAADNCAVTSKTVTLSGATSGVYASLNGKIFNKGVTTVLWWAQDAAGLTATCSYTVTVQDLEKPYITCPSVVNPKPVDLGVCTWTAVGLDATATDNCTFVTLSYQLSGATTSALTMASLNGVKFEKGITTVTWTATDGNNNTSVCAFTVTVVDLQKPSITCPAPATRYVPANACVVTDAAAFAGAVVTVMDNCTASSMITIDHNPKGPFGLGNHTITWSANDNNGNIATCTQLLTVLDNISPTIACNVSGMQTVNAGSNCKYNKVGTSWDVTYTENCIPTVTYLLTGATSGTGSNTLNGVNFELGTTTVLWTVADNSGLTATCAFTVKVVDVTKPIITCPPFKLDYTTANDCYNPSVNIGTAVGLDNCPPVTAMLTYSNHPSTAYPLGSTFVTWTIVDGSNNSSQCVQIVQIVDNVLPVLTPAAPITIVATGGACSIPTPANILNGTGYPAPTISDNCIVLDTTVSVPATLNIGMNYILWTATDGSFNTGTCVQTIILKDNTVPVIACIADTTANTDLDLCTFTKLGTSFDAVATDNCGVTSLTAKVEGVNNAVGLTTLAGYTFNKGVSTVTWTAKDGGNNSVSCSFKVTVQDKQAPAVTCVGDQVYTLPSNATVCKYTHAGTAWNATALDNCTASPTITRDYTLSGATVKTTPGTNLNAQAFNRGVTTVLWSAKDADNNVATCSFTVTVIDVTAPSITFCPGNQTASVGTTGCFYTKVSNSWNAIAKDTCGIATLTYTLSGVTTGSGATLNGVAFNPGVTSVLWTALDVSGLTTTCAFTVNVLSNTAPIVTCVGDQVVNINQACTYKHSGTAWNASATASCGTASLAYYIGDVTTGISGSNLNNQIFNIGVNTVTWVATDAALNTGTCSFLVTVIDNVTPTINCQPSYSVNAPVNTCSALITLTKPTVSDACSGSGAIALTASVPGYGVIPPTGPNIIYNFPVGATTVTWQAVDVNMNSSTCTQVVFVYDIQEPVINNCPSGTVTVNNNLPCKWLGSGFTATATDNCSSTATLLFSVNNGPYKPGNGNDSLFTIGTHVIRYKAVDGSLNTATCSFTLVVNDVTLPTLTCPTGSPFNKTTDASSCGWTGSGLTPASYSDNCVSPTLSYSVNGGSTYTNGNANGYLFPLGTTTVIYKVVDVNNASNVVSCSFIVNVTDKTKPTLTAPANLTKATDLNTCTWTTIGNELAPVALSDNCTASPTITHSFTGVTTKATTSGVAVGTFAKGVTTITYIASDAAGNTETKTFTVTVNDGQLPTITCPANVNAVTNTNQCTWTGAGLAPLATADNCGAPTLSFKVKTDLSAGTYANGNANGFAFPIGTSTVTYKVSDGTNEATCSFLVVVADGQVPTLNCPANKVVSITSNCGWVGTGLGVNPTDNCGTIPPSLAYSINGGVYTGGDANGYVFPIGVTTVTYRSIDISNNQITCSFTVSVVDAQAPTFASCPSNMTKNSDAGQCTWTATGSVLAPGVATDNCGTPAITYMLTGATVVNGNGTVVGAFNPGITTVTYHATDGYGNIGTCVFTVTVVDAQAPTITCPGNQMMDTDLGECAWFGTGLEAGLSDNCGTPTLTYAVNGGSYNSGDANGYEFPIGITTITYLASDLAGNAVSCTFTVTVTDTYVPTLDCPENVVKNILTNECFWTPQSPSESLIPNSYDNCQLTLYYSINNTTSYVQGDVNAYEFPIGVTTVNYKVVDGSSNTAYCQFTVTVLDDVSPEITCPANVSQTDNLVVAASVTPFYSDNCGIPALTYTLTGATNGLGTGLAIGTYNTGTTVVTYTVTDLSGNADVCSFTVNIQPITPVNNISGKLLYNNTASTPMNNSTVNLVQGTSVIATTTTDNDGSFTFTNLNDGAYSLEASTNKPWGGANSTDALWTVRHFTQIYPLSGLQLQVADVNASNFVNSVDALLIARRFVNIINSFPAGDWAFETPSVTLNGASEYVEFKSECYGDVNRSWIPGAKTQATTTLGTAGTLYVNSNSEFVLPISTSANLNAGAVSLVVNFPTNLFDITGVKVVGANDADVVYNVVGNELRMAWYNTEAISANADEAVLMINMKAKDLSNMNSEALELNAATEIADETGTVQFANLTMPKLAVALNSLEVNVYPNPFSSKTVFSLNLPEAATVNIMIYDLVGNEVSMISNNNLLNSGNHTVNFDATSLNQGIYTYRMVVKSATGEQVKTGRLVITR